ncbi:MAG: polymorphic toxin type 24 domain-containing protein [Streptosporangiaceae bacterium]
MSDGDLGAVFKGLADDAAQAGEDIGESIARFTEETADNEDANVARTLEADARLAKDAQAIGKEGAAASAETEKLSAQDLIDGGTEFNGTGGRSGNRLPDQGGLPGGVLYKRNPETGDITNYTQYDQDGNAVKRVDLTGRSHGGVPTPHVEGPIRPGECRYVVRSLQR